MVRLAAGHTHSVGSAFTSRVASDTGRRGRPLQHRDFEDLLGHVGLLRNVGQQRQREVRLRRTRRPLGTGVTDAVPWGLPNDFSNGANENFQLGSEQLQVLVLDCAYDRV